MIDDRLFIMADGQGVDIEVLKHAVSKIDLGRLKTMKASFLGGVLKETSV